MKTGEIGPGDMRPKLIKSKYVKMSM